MKKFLWTLKNLAKIFLWIVFLSILMDWLGMTMGIIIFAFTCLVWNLSLTLFRVYRIFGLDNFKIAFNTIFSKQAYLPFIAYGCFCSPKYGVNWATKDLTPIDGLDEACERHDEAMFYADNNLQKGLISKKEHAILKNKGDWEFIKEAITSKNYANGMYILMFEIGFLGRLVVRSIKKLFL